jgi:hypothetical protein
MRHKLCGCSSDYPVVCALRSHRQVRQSFGIRKQFITEAGAGDGSCAFRRWRQATCSRHGGLRVAAAFINTLRDLTLLSPSPHPSCQTSLRFLHFCKCPVSSIVALANVVQLPTLFTPPTILPMAAKKRCQFQINTNAQCSSAALRIVGECPHCRAQFCSSVSTLYSPVICHSLIRPCI